MFVAQIMRNSRSDIVFKEQLEQNEMYYKIRPYLSEAFLESFNRPRTVFIQSDGKTIPVLMEKFLNELDRLEGEWGLC